MRNSQESFIEHVTEKRREMVRFSVGDEEEEETSIGGSKRRNTIIEYDTANKFQKFGENQEEEEEVEEEEWNEDDEEEEEEDWVADEEAQRYEEEDAEESCACESRGSISITVDPDVLECSICCEPLRPPLYQCQNGHVVCSTCCAKLQQDKCPTCSQSAIFTRCRALESVIESIKSSCCYARYGCRQSLPYAELISHQETCAFAPCFCPIPDCTFSGFTEQLSTHVGAYHEGSAVAFRYGEHFTVSLRREEPFQVLHEQYGPLFLLLNDRVTGFGNALSVACICSSPLECEIMYQLVVGGCGSSLELRASAMNVRKWVGAYPSKVLLWVPQEFCSDFGEINVDVCIRGKG